MSAFSSLESSFLRTMGSLLAPGGARGSLLVLIYHRVLEQRDPLIDDEPDAATFSAEMDLIGSICNVLPLQEAVDRLASGSLPPRAACITFDDGYANNRTVAAPILQARRMPATVFVATGFIGDGRMFNDRPSAWPARSKSPSVSAWRGRVA
jgi:peptidoglycan/xylan/chitin deacetylase (PgdA/CDA1 family)